jgi:hypothetical protein
MKLTWIGRMGRIKIYCSILLSQVEFVPETKKLLK